MHCLLDLSPFFLTLLKVLVQVGEESSLLSSLDYFRRDTIFAWSFDTGEGVDGLVEFLYSG